MTHDCEINCALQRYIVIMKTSQVQYSFYINIQRKYAPLRVQVKVVGKGEP